MACLATLWDEAHRNLLLKRRSNNFYLPPTGFQQIPQVIVIKPLFNLCVLLGVGNADIHRLYSRGTAYCQRVKRRSAAGLILDQYMMQQSVRFGFLASY